MYFAISFDTKQYEPGAKALLSVSIFFFVVAMFSVGPGHAWPCFKARPDNNRYGVRPVAFGLQGYAIFHSSSAICISASAICISFLPADDDVWLPAVGDVMFPVMLFVGLLVNQLLFLSAGMVLKMFCVIMMTDSRCPLRGSRVEHYPRSSVERGWYSPHSDRLRRARARGDACLGILGFDYATGCYTVYYDNGKKSEPFLSGKNEAAKGARPFYYLESPYCEFVTDNLIFRAMMIASSCFTTQIVSCCSCVIVRIISCCSCVMEPIISCCSCVMEPIISSVRRDERESTPLEDPLCEGETAIDLSDETKLRALIGCAPLHGDPPTAAAVKELEYFTKPHPCRLVSCRPPRCKDFRLYRLPQLLLHGKLSHPTALIVGMIMILFLMVLSYCSLKQVTSAGQANAAQEMPVAHFFQAKFYLKAASLFIMVVMLCLRPPSDKVVTSSATEHPTKYISATKMTLIYDYVNTLLDIRTESARCLVVGDGKLIYKLMKCLKIATMCYFKRMLISTATSSLFMCMQTWFDHATYDVLPIGEERNIVYSALIFDTAILSVYLALFSYFAWDCKARMHALSALVDSTRSLEHQIQASAASGIQPCSPVSSTSHNPNDPSSLPSTQSLV
jgi:hypothetical protein